MNDRLDHARILVPVDGSEGALRAARIAGEIARVTDGTVCFLYVALFDESTDEAEVAWLPESVAGSTAEESQAIFAAAAAVLPEGVSHAAYRRAGAAAEEILRFIDETGCDLVALGGRRSSRVSGILLGSVTQAVLERAQTRVLIAGQA